MITGLPADVPVALDATGRNDDDSALLKWISGDERLPESLQHGRDGVHNDARRHQCPPTVSHLQRAVRLTFGIREQGTGEVMFVAERAGLVDRAVSNHDELGAERADALALRHESSDLLAAEQAAEVADEHQHCGLLRPELTEANVMTVRILDGQCVEQMRHLQGLAESFLKPLAIAATERQFGAVPQMDGAFTGQ